MRARSGRFKAVIRIGRRRAVRGVSFIQAPLESRLRSLPEVTVARPKPVLLLILDGWGHREETEDNAIALASTPNWNQLLADCPHTLVHTDRKSVV